MREIKFRAWHDGNYDKKRGTWIHKPQMLYDEKPGDCLVYVNQNQNIKSVMQYTGLKDVNGKEIYEGDIVQYYKNRSLDTEKALTLVVYKGCMFTVPFEPQVYGNIYENPELFEGVQ